MRKGNKLNDFVDEDFKLNLVLPHEKAVEYGFAKKEDEYEPMPKRSSVPKSYEEMTIEELQAEILAKMAANGPVTDRMKQDVTENIYRNSLMNWVRSFR